MSDKAAPLDVVIVSDFTADLFAGYLQNGEELPKVTAKTTGFGQVQQVLGGETLGRTVDLAIVWTRPEAVIPSFARLLDLDEVPVDALLAEVKDFAESLRRFASQAKSVFVPSWAAPPRRMYGLLDMQPGRGLAHAIHAMNAALAEALADTNVHVLDIERWLASAPRADAFSAKRWYLGKVAFANPVFREAARDIKAALRGLYGQSKKLVIVDLDDTLWGGIVGDDGWQNLVLGGHDAVGEALVDFQRALKSLARRGVLLGIVSKNTEAVALEAIDKHPEMVLKLGDFAGTRINWQDKARNVADLAEELNLGLQSVVFIDDNPIERSRVREALPEVLVPEWPTDKTLYPQALYALDCFEAARISKEDRERAKMYAVERERKAHKANVSVDEWLASLETRVKVESLGDANLKRTVQLLNKTNQLNLRTRRMTEADYLAWSREPNHRVLTISVEDKFGSSGLTGIVSVAVDGAASTIEDFVLSCRVMGRRVEETMLAVAMKYARGAGATRMLARYLPTPKNGPCLEFFRRSGLTSGADGEFSAPLDDEPPMPEHITVVEPEG